MTDATAPTSPSNVLRQVFPAGLIGGNGGGGGNYFNFNGLYNDVYFGFKVKVDNNYVNHPVGTKLAWIHTNTNLGNNLVLRFDGSGPYILTLHYQNNDIDNSHLGGPNPGTIIFYPSGPSLIKGQWATIEWYYKPSSCPTCRNGIYKLWLDGTLIHNITTMNTDTTTRPGAVSFITTWGGVGTTLPSDSYLYVDHARVSIPNCSGACVGGPASDTTPPSSVSGVMSSGVHSTSGTLSWSAASDNVGVIGYNIERCLGVGCATFANIATLGPVLTYTDTTLTPGTSYSYRLKARDLAGNVSTSYSSTVSFTTSGTALPSMTSLNADATGADVAWTGSPASIRVATDTTNIVEPMTAFPIVSETIAHVQSRSVAGSGTSISLAYSSNNTAGNFLALRLHATPSSVSISNCSDTRGNSWVAVPNATGGSGGYQAIRYAKNALAGANTVTCTLTGAATASVLDIFEKSGVDRTSPLDQSKLTQQTDPGTGANAVSSGSVVTTADGELILGATLQVGSTVYSASADFSGTQGPIWYYKDEAGVNLVWNGSGLWQGTGFTSIWEDGGHPDYYSGGPVRRWVAPADGAVRITGTALNSSGCPSGSNGINVYIKKNGTTLWSQLISGSTSYPFDISTTVVSTDTLDFQIDSNGHGDCDNTEFDPTITLGTSSGSGGTTTAAGTGFTLRHATASDSPSEDRIQTSAGSIAATFTGADAANDYITSIATFKPASSSIRYSRIWPLGTTFVCMFARDAAGNENSISPGYKCDSVSPTADTTPPVRSSAQPGGTLAAGTTQSTISIVTDEYASCRYSTSAGVSYGSMVNDLDASLNYLFHSKTITGLSDGNTYTYYVRCRDIFLNANSSDSTISFDVDTVAGDVIAPSQVMGLAGEALNAGQISLSWIPATDNVAVTGYQIYATESGGTYTLMATSSTLSAVVSGLSGQTLYLAKVRALDAGGNTGAFSDPIVILTPQSDVTKPSAVTGLVVMPVTFQSMDVSWDAGSDDVGIASTSLEQCRGSDCTDFILAAVTTAGTSVRIGNLLPQTTYRFRAKHTDFAGNVSIDYSPIVSGTTLAVPVGTVTAVCPCKHHR